MKLDWDTRILFCLSLDLHMVTAERRFLQLSCWSLIHLRAREGLLFYLASPLLFGRALSAILCIFRISSFWFHFLVFVILTSVALENCITAFRVKLGHTLFSITDLRS